MFHSSRQRDAGAEKTPSARLALPTIKGPCFQSLATDSRPAPAPCFMH